MVVRNWTSVVQRERTYAIVDEVDNILIDEARTPLIISGQPRNRPTSTALRQARCRGWSPGRRRRRRRRLHRRLENRPVSPLTEEGVAKIETLLGVENIYAPENF